MHSYSQGFRPEEVVVGWGRYKGGVVRTVGAGLVTYDTADKNVGGTGGTGGTGERTGRPRSQGVRHWTEALVTRF